MRAARHLPCAHASGAAAPPPAGAGQRARRRPRCAPNAFVAAAAAAAAAPWPSQQPQPRLVYVLDEAPGHAKDAHPEGPQRVRAIAAALAAAGLEAHGAAPLGAAAAAAWRGAAAREALQRVHPPQYLERLESICRGLEAPTLVDESTYIAPGSFLAGLEAMAAVLACLDAVMGGPDRAGDESGGGQSSGGGGQSSSDGQRSGAPNAGSEGGRRGCAGFCVVRPPGHHVTPSRPMGFGLLNLVAAAAATAKARPGVARVMVLDFDVHHGNGSEAAFEADASVLYLSLHQQGLWPYTGKAAFVGIGEGAGATINVPLPGGAGDAAARLAWGAVVAPAARRFKPDVLIVSAGYDAHWRDPLAALQLCSSSFHWMGAGARALADELCGGRVLLVLEGGYHLESLGESVAETLRGVLGLPPATPPPEELAAARLLQPEPMARAQRAVEDAVRRHRLG
ncbi:hypothetical protein Rsub_04798 [Raphidocelis subcapitata]|uniref:Histone deacetylase domain-containing protein n=1 Tax=Raphidocelis subcapitata TaxID=307507 RepID=A0A2V0NUW4_9CHLO|nr:hypothetical protein Rsub_04798 [Raphidocelis subcapitata]|eukprot:GBF91129.1 hypothetical protein Rsub_04798 [Raphidocelis subcapitata]